MIPISISISIVSHGQMGLVFALLNDLQKHCVNDSLEVLLTVNVPEELPPSLSHFPFAIKIIRNPHPLGFGENHNRALQLAGGKFFCVINPDIRISFDIFPTLLSVLKDARVGVVAPLVMNKNGQMEDSARVFPTPFKIICKIVGGCKGGDYLIKDTCISPDWVGGMFMVFCRDVYRELRGFNQHFFLYYEDVDLCARIWLQGLKVVLVPQVSVMHDARRSSHKKALYLFHHIRSMARFFTSPTYWRVMYLRKLAKVVR